MKVYCVIPVHNRLDSTRKCIEDLLAQDVDGELEIVVVDDGSTDGTTDLLRRVEHETHTSLKRVTYRTGSGDWWWSRCMNEGINYLAQELKQDDGVLFMNDDVALDPGYISRLVETWSVRGPSIVMSQLVDINEPECPISSPIRVDSKRLEIRAREIGNPSVVGWSTSDVAPGRGTLYPAGVFIRGLRIDAQHLPHYLADYEFSVRARRLGYPILVAHQARVMTEQDWGNSKRKRGIRWRLFAPESPDLVRAYWQFWRTASPNTSRFVLGMRLLRYRLLPSVIGITRKKVLA